MGEHKVTCLHRHDVSKAASVEYSSVNAVLLDAAGSSFDHLMVAAHVNVSGAGDRLSLRSTSWLPRRPGLGALATLIFSPRAEIRTNKSRSRLTGVLTGLGPARTSKELNYQLSLMEKTEAFFPEHDVETRFDVTITNEDLDLVNKIRYWMNVCLSKTEPDQLMRLTQIISLDKAQKGIKEAMEVLLINEKKVVEKEGLPSGREYRWNLRDEQYKLHKEIPGDEGFIFKMIDGVKLVDYEEVDHKEVKMRNLEDQLDLDHCAEVDKSEVDDVEMKMRQLVEMWGNMKQGDNSKLTVAVVCPVCPDQDALSTRQGLYLHLQTALHKEQESKIEALALEDD